MLVAMYGMVISSPSLMGRTAVRTREKRLRSHSHFAFGSQLYRKETSIGIGKWEREREQKVKNSPMITPARLEENSPMGIQFRKFPTRNRQLNSKGVDTHYSLVNVLIFARN